MSNPKWAYTPARYDDTQSIEAVEKKSQLPTGYMWLHVSQENQLPVIASYLWLHVSQKSQLSVIAGVL